MNKLLRHIPGSSGVIRFSNRATIVITFPDYALELLARIQLRSATEFLADHGPHAASLIVYGRRPMLLELLEPEGRPN